LLKLGDPTFLNKWETSYVLPTLAQVRTARVVERFGVDASNWGALLHDATLSGRRFGLSRSRLVHTTLQLAVAPPEVVAPTLAAMASASAPAVTPTTSVSMTIGVDGSRAAMSDTFRLNRTPLVRQDGDFPFGGEEKWSDGIALDAHDFRPDVPYPSHVLAQWTIGSGNASTYERVVSVTLDYNKNIPSNRILVKNF
jgi:hypothetical protein